MTEPATPSQLLHSVAPEFGATLAVEGDTATTTIVITLPSGKQQAFELSLSAVDSRVSVRESQPGQVLPAFCPDRHINSDGTFCLGWGAQNPNNIIDEASARTWWSALVRYLSSQVTANKRKVWPGSENDRAHGDAAQYQETAESAARTLGLVFEHDLRNGNFCIRSDRRRRNPRLELYRSGKRIARVFLNSGRLVKDRIACPCDAPAAPQIAACSDHAKSLEVFTLAKYQQHLQEKRYLDGLVAEGKQCCGTLQNCGLREASSRRARTA